MDLRVNMACRICNCMLADDGKFVRSGLKLSRWLSEHWHTLEKEHRLGYDMCSFFAILIFNIFYIHFHNPYGTAFYFWYDLTFTRHNKQNFFLFWFINDFWDKFSIENDSALLEIKKSIRWFMNEVNLIINIIWRGNDEIWRNRYKLRAIASLSISVAFQRWWQAISRAKMFVETTSWLEPGPIRISAQIFICIYCRWITRWIQNYALFRIPFEEYLF